MASIAVRSRYEALKKEASELESQIKQLQDALDTLLRIQQRYVSLSFTGIVSCRLNGPGEERELVLSDWTEGAALFRSGVRQYSEMG